MNNNSRFDSSGPNIDDTTLDRLLESLPRFDTAEGFEARVMLRVCAPPPIWVQSLKRSLRLMAETRRFQWIGAGLMATSTISLVVATTFVLTNFPTVSRLWHAFVGFASDSAHTTFGNSAPLLFARGIAHSHLDHITIDIAAMIAAFVAMCSLGFGLVFFAPRQLEVVADTVRNSFWRSFLAGFFAQPLVLALFVLLLLGLALTVVGILVIPFAAIAFTAAAVLGGLGGYLAVARAVGEAYLRRQMALDHAVGGWPAYQYSVYGLIALFTIWLPATLLGWAPAAGQVFTATAILITWFAATVGFGATIISHAGIRRTFTRRIE